MKRYMIGYCWTCARRTKQRVIEAKDSAAWRVFETITTLGFALLTPHDYECECTVCGEFNTLTKEQY